MVGSRVSKIPPVTGLSYQVILIQSRILLPNCPCEAGAVNRPCNTVPSGWPLCQCASSLCGMLQSWGWSSVGPSTSWCVSYHLVCGNESVCTEHLAMCVSQLFMFIVLSRHRSAERALHKSDYYGCLYLPGH